MCKEVGAEMMLECSAKTAIGVKELFDNAVRVALCARGYRRKSRMNSACQWCGKHSKATCKCERMKAKVHRDNKDCSHTTRYNHGMLSLSLSLSRSLSNTHNPTHMQPQPRTTTRNHAQPRTTTHNHTQATISRIAL